MVVSTSTCPFFTALTPPWSCGINYKINNTAYDCRPPPAHLLSRSQMLYPLSYKSLFNYLPCFLSPILKQFQRTRTGSVGALLPVNALDSSPKYRSGPGIKPPQRSSQPPRKRILVVLVPCKFLAKLIILLSNLRNPRVRENLVWDVLGQSALVASFFPVDQPPDHLVPIHY